MKVLFWDTETSLILGGFWGLYQQDIPYAHVIQDWFILSAAWQWEGGTIEGVSILDNPKLFSKDHTDDYHVVKTIYDVISRADVIVGHNNNRFDWPKFMTRVIYHNLDPIDPPMMVDTLKEARKYKFTSNKLGDLANFLEISEKQKTETGDWIKATQGDPDAISRLFEYNKKDIPPLRDLYYILRPYMKSHPNHNLFLDGKCCPKCGSGEVIMKGTRPSGVSLFRRWKCKDCGGWFRSKASIKGVDFR